MSEENNYIINNPLIELGYNDKYDSSLKKTTFTSSGGAKITITSGDGEEKKKKKEKKNEIISFDINLPKPAEIVSNLDKFIYGHRKTKEALAISMKNLEHRIKYPQIDFPKSNALLFGDTGVGKTYLVETIAKILNLPIVKLKMT